MNADGAQNRARLGIVLATPPGFNAGMIATEIALDAFLARHGLQDTAQRYRFISLASRFRGRPAELAAIGRRWSGDATDWSAVERYDDLVRSDVLLYWADFLHLAQYLDALRRLTVMLGEPGGDTGAYVDRVFLLADADDAVLARTLSFGTNLLFNTPRDERQPAYGTALRRFATGARRVWVRDALSASRVARLRGDYRQGYFGVDCALLLRASDVAPAPGCVIEPGGVLTFFARDRDVAPMLRRLATALAAALDRPLRMLPWGDADAFPEMTIDQLPPALPPDADARSLLAAVAGAALVVTDAYHLAAVAWALGVPAVGAFGFAREGERSVNAGAEFNRRDKREVWFSQYDALEFLVRPEELVDTARLERRIAALTDAIADVSLREAIVANVRSHADAVEADLAAELREMLG